MEADVLAPGLRHISIRIITNQDHPVGVSRLDYPTLPIGFHWAPLGWFRKLDFVMMLVHFHSCCSQGEAGLTGVEPRFCGGSLRFKRRGNDLKSEKPSTFGCLAEESGSWRLFSLSRLGGYIYIYICDFWFNKLESLQTSLESRTKPFVVQSTWRAGPRSRNTF